MGEVLGRDQHGDIWVRKSSGGGCFTSLGFGIMVVVIAAIAIGSIFSGLAAIIGNGIFSPYHVFTADHNDAVRTAVRNYVGTDKYAGLFETDVASVGLGSYLSKDDPNFSNVTLDSELGGFPGKVYTVDQTGASYWFEFDNVGIQRQGHCLLIVYIKPTPGVSHTIYAQVIGYQDQAQAYTFHIKPGEDSGSADIGITGSDQYSYTVEIQGDVGTPLEAIVVDRSGQESSSSSTSSSTAPTPTPAPIRLAAKYSGKRVIPGATCVFNTTDCGIYQDALEITKTNADGSFEGKWYDTYNTYDYNDTIETDIYFVTGVSIPFDKANSGSNSYGINPMMLQQLQQQDGDNGVLLEFIAQRAISGNRCGGDNSDCTRYDFYGVLSNGSVKGIWSSASGFNGTFEMSS